MDLIIRQDGERIVSFAFNISETKQAKKATSKILMVKPKKKYITIDIYL